MIPVESGPREPLSGLPLRSLYGEKEESLRPRPEDLEDLDLLLIDLQDIGSRYYTYVWTAAMAAQAAQEQGVRVLILDRPNPIGGAVEGGWIQPGFESFVGRWSIPNRHGLTLGELVSWVAAREGFEVEVLELEGWSRAEGLGSAPWVQPSPNMPSPQTALVYPGSCLFEGTLMSEGRGTTRPFELLGANFVDPFRWAQEMESVALPGLHLRPCYFRPSFHKFAGESIGGLGLHVIDPLRFQPLRCGLQLLGALRRLYGAALQWRREPYEFVSEHPAIDLLCGGEEARLLLESGANSSELDMLWERWQREAAQFEVQRQPFMRYP